MVRDVRMRGFAERADVEEVLDFLRASTRTLPGEEVALLDCVGRVLDEFSRQVWLLTLDDLRHTPRVRAFMDHMAQAIAG